MKHFKLLAILFALILGGCSLNNNPGEQASEQEQSDNHDSKDHGDQADDDDDHTLTLNNGKKWMLDSSTRHNIALIKAYAGDTANFINYETGYEGLKERTDKLVKECHMSGPDHDALHSWLEPYMDHLKGIKKGNDKTKSYVAVRDHLNEFDRYFE